MVNEGVQVFVNLDLQQQQKILLHYINIISILKHAMNNHYDDGPCMMMMIHFNKRARDDMMKFLQHRYFHHVTTLHKKNQIIKKCYNITYCRRNMGRSFESILVGK